MAISINDLRFYKSERMSDFQDSGGQMSGNEIISGQENQIWDDISDVDRAAGDVSIRKIYAAVTSANTDKYLDAGVTLIKSPEDAATTVLLFSTGSYYDERAAIADVIQQYVSRGADSGLRLIGDHVVGQRILYGYRLKPLSTASKTLFFNATLSVKSDAHEQYVRVLRVKSQAATYLYMEGGTQRQFDVEEVLLDLAAPLQYFFTGSELDPASDYDPPTHVYTTQVTAPSAFIGLSPLTAQVTTGSYTLAVNETKQQMVPIDYQDLGENIVTFPAATLQEVYAAPDGFYLEQVISGTVTGIAYRYGEEWIMPGMPNSANYFAGTISFPLRPDTGSSVVVWHSPDDLIYYTEETFTHSSNTLITLTSTATLPLTQGTLAVECTIYYTGTPSRELAIGPIKDYHGDWESNNDIQGTINYSTGEFTVELRSKSYQIIMADSVKLRHYQATSGVTFFAEIIPSPVISGSVRVVAHTMDDNTELEATDNGLGALSGDGIIGSIDYLSGLIQMTFPESVYSSTISVFYRFGGLVPQNAERLGIDPMRLPRNGKMPIYLDGQMVLIHHTGTHSENSLSPTQQVDMGRLRLYRVVIEDADTKRFPANFYAVNRETGIVTMASDLNLTGYTSPYTFRHTIADLCVINRVSHTEKTLTLSRPVSHTFPADESLVSSVLYIGTMQARYENLFAQSTWSDIWSDTLIGDEPIAQYNDVTYPLVVSNLGAYPDRFVLRFTSSTNFTCYGENLGYLGTGNINENFAPVNSLTGQTYFTLDYRGWGGGWSTGNCVRFNLIGANYPIDVIRAIQPSQPAGDLDQVELLLIGNVNA